MIQSIIRRRNMGLNDEVIAKASDNGFNYVVLKRSYEAGYIASPDKLWKSEAKNILQVRTNLPSDDEKTGAMGADLSWVQYLENAEFVNTYMYLGFLGCFMILPPQCAINGVYLVRVKHKIVLPVRTPFPLFNTYDNSSPYNKSFNGWQELTNSTIYVPDKSYDDWLPYIQHAEGCPSWMDNTGITCARISDLTSEEQAKIKINY